MATKSGPKDVFLHLLMMGALYVSAFSFISLLFGYIDVLFPDQLGFYYGRVLDGIRRSTATLIILFPVYLLTSWFLSKEFKVNPEKRESRIRKWVIYLTLFIASIAVIADLIVLVLSFLNGELTVRFIIKVLTVLIVAGGVFWYYVWDIKRQNLASKVPKILAWILSIVILISIGGGFYLVGSPLHQRQVRIDEGRVNDLQVLQNEIVNYWINKNVLPGNLADLKDSIRGFIPPVDPDSKENYEYNVSGPLSFELCAIFKTTTQYQSSKSAQFSRVKEPLPFPTPYQQNWDYEEGRTCFEREIDPELYRKEPLR